MNSLAKTGLGFLVFLVVCSFVVAGGPGNWTYHSGDLGGANCIQDYLDIVLTGTLGTVQATNVTATGTVQGEQITSTDGMAASGALTVDEGGTFGGALLGSNTVAFVPSASTTITNGQTGISLAGSVTHLLNASGEIANGTNIVTLGNVSQAGQIHFLVNVSASTNKIAIAQSGNWLSAAVELDPNETLVFVAGDTNQFYGIE